MGGHGPVMEWVDLYDNQELPLCVRVEIVKTTPPPTMIRWEKRYFRLHPNGKYIEGDMVNVGDVRKSHHRSDEDKVGDI